MAIRVLYIFRKRQLGFHSIENLFSSIQKSLPSEVEFDNWELPYHEGFLSVLKNIVFVLKKYKSIRQYDLVHITGDITYITPFILNRTVITFHDIGSLGRDKEKIKRFFLRFFWVILPSLFATKITVISSFTREEISKEHSFIKKKLVHIPNCLSDEWRYCKKKITSSGKTILTVGTKKNKNLERTIRALEGLDINLMIVGRLGNEIVNFLIKSKLDYVVFYDLDYKQMQKLYLQADILLFPSLYEGFGLPIIEAQAVGIPVITSNIEPMTSVADGGALKVNPYDYLSIRQGVQALLQNEDLRAELVNKGFLNVKKYFCSQISEQYAKLYKEIIKKY